MKKCILIFSLPAVASLVIPNILYYSNIRDWNYDYSLIVVYFLLALVLFAGLLVIQWILSRFLPRLSPFFPHVCFMVALFLICKDTFSPIKLGVLDGTNLSSPQPVINTVKEIIILVAVCTLGVIVYRKRSGFSMFFSALIVIFGFSFFLFSLIVSLSAEGGSGMKSERPTVNSSRVIKGNVYHFHLDAAQSDYFLYCLKKYGIEGEFRGFTAYGKNTTCYPYTEPSVASYMTSTTFHGGRYDEWVYSNAEGLLKVLRENGYHLNYYGTAKLFGGNVFDSMVTSENLLRQKSCFGQLRDFFSIISARIMPNCVTNYTVKFSGELIAGITSFFRKNDDEKIPGTIAEGVEPYSGVLLLKKLISDEKTRAANGEYVYAVPGLPHSPWVMDRYGKINTGKKGSNAEAYLEQTYCAVNLMVDFIRELKRLNRFNDSMIVIHGDHGEGWVGDLVLKGNEVHSSLEYRSVTPFKPEIHQWSLSHLEPRTRALLLMKTPGNSGLFNISDLETQLIDVYPTISDTLGLSLTATEKKRIEGMNIFGKLDPFKTRKRFLYYFVLGISKYKPEIYNLEVKFNGPNMNLVPNASGGDRYIGSVKNYDVIKFDQSDVSSKYVMSGWSGQEPSYRWTDGPVAKLSFNLAFEPRGDLYFSIVAFPFKDQRVSVVANGTTCGLWEIAKEGRYEVKIPKSVLGKKSLDIQFNISKPSSPKENKLSEDDRKLGIAVKELSLSTMSFASGAPSYESIEYDRSVEFDGSSDMSSKYIVSGWSGQEPSFRWTDGPVATLSFNLMSVPRDDVIFSLDAFPFLVTNKVAAQNVSVSVNGVLCGKLHITKNDTYRVKIPKNLLSDRKCIVALGISNPSSPQENGMSADFRKLGIAVSNVTISEGSGSLSHAKNMNIFYRIFIYPIESIMKCLLELVYSIFHSFGIAILAVSAGISIMLLPLYHLAEHLQEKERRIQRKMKPKIDEYKSVYKSYERHLYIKNIYRQNNYHPIFALRTTFGLLIQVPFFIAGFHLLSHYAPLNGVSSLVFRDLGKPDGLVVIAGYSINLMPFVMTFFNLSAAFVYGKKIDMREKIQLYVMAMLFLILLYFSPAGLLLYWTCNNIFNLLKNIVYRLLSDHKERKISAPVL